MRAKYMRRMCSNNLEIRIAGSSCRPQRLLLLLVLLLLLPLPLPLPLPLLHHYRYHYYTTTATATTTTITTTVAAASAAATTTKAKNEQEYENLTGLANGLKCVGTDASVTHPSSKEIARKEIFTTCCSRN